MNIAPGALAVDTNLLLYAHGAGDEAEPRRELARACLGRLPCHRLVLPVQVLGEFHRALRRKFGIDARRACLAVEEWTAVFATLETTGAALEAALSLTDSHQFDTWDALIMAVAAQHRCRALLTEDLQHGFTWRGVTVVNPLLHPDHPLLAL